MSFHQMLALAGIMLLSVTGCSDDFDAPRFSIDNNENAVSLHIGEDGGDVTLKVVSNYDWKIIGEIPYWVSPASTSGAAGSDVVLDVARNNSYERRCTLKVASLTKVVDIDIRQDAGTAGDVEVTTGNSWYNVTSPSNYSVVCAFTLRNAHLAAGAGVEVDGTKYPCENFNELYNDVSFTIQRLGGVSTLRYRAYAFSKVSQSYVYGQYKNIGDE